LVEKRLITGNEVDDRQAAVAEPHPPRAMETVAVRSAMAPDIGNAQQQHTTDPDLSAIIKDPSYPAHFMIRVDKSKIAPFLNRRVGYRRSGACAIHGCATAR